MTAREFCKKLANSNYSQEQKNFLFDSLTYFSTVNKECLKNYNYEEVWERWTKQIENWGNAPKNLSYYIITTTV